MRSSFRPGLLALSAIVSIGGFAVTLAAKSGDEIPSEDPLIPRLHSLGLIEGRTDIYRCACPVMDVAKEMKGIHPSPDEFARAKAEMQHIHDLGIRTVISLENQDPPREDEPPNPERVAVALEESAARAVGLTYVAFPMSGHGPNSFEDMSDEAVYKMLDHVSTEIFQFARNGGVVFHCKAGHDRTGLLAAYLRVKYQHWSADQAIAEMRRDGHNWPKFAKKGATSSWLEDHLRAIAVMLNHHAQPGDAASLVPKS